MLPWLVKPSDEIDDGHRLVAMRARSAQPDAPHESLAILAGRLPDGPLSAVAALLDGQCAARSARGRAIGIRRVVPGDQDRGVEQPRRHRQRSWSARCSRSARNASSSMWGVPAATSTLRAAVPSPGLGCA